MSAISDITDTEKNIVEASLDQKVGQKQGRTTGR